MMSHASRRGGIGFAAAVAAVLALAAVPAAGQIRAATDEAPARTPWGHPNLQGLWNNNTVVPLERPDDLAEREELSDEEVAARFQANSDFLFTPREGDPGFYNEFWFEYGQDTNRTSLIIDPRSGKLPPLTPEAAERAAAVANFATLPAVTGDAASWEELSLFDRCITRGMPGAMSPGFYNHNYRILQTPDHVVMLVEMIHDVRIIPLEGRPHPSPAVRQWLGDSVGRWEGDTLVVETTNFTDRVNTRGVTVFGGSERMRLVERFTRIGPDTIDYRYTIEDPVNYTAPWTAAIPMTRIEGEIFEYACHEGNYSVANILRGARANEQQEQ